MNQIDEYHETVSSDHSPYHETKYQEKFTESIKEEDTKDNKERIPIKTKTDEKGYKDDMVAAKPGDPGSKRRGRLPKVLMTKQK